MTDLEDDHLRGIYRAVVGIAAVTLLALVLFLVQAVNRTAGVSEEIRDGQVCIIGTLLFQPADRAGTPGGVFDDICGFEPGTTDRFRADHNIKIPETENQ